MTMSMSSRRLVVTAIPAFIAAFAFLILPCTASATLADEIEVAFQEAILNMAGTEFGQNDMTINVFDTEVTITLLGFALCEPLDPYAPPDPAPVVPLNIYRCENITSVSADVAPDETGAGIAIEFSRIFLDLKTSRNETILCALNGDTFPYDGTVNEDAYLLANAIVNAEVELALVDGCYHVSLVPGSASFALVPEEMGTRDDCLAANMDSILMPVIYPVVEDFLDAVFEQALVDLMSEIDQLLCDATPADRSTWGSVKSIFR